MALIYCPECKKKISSSANICPNCGYDISSIENLDAVVEESQEKIQIKSRIAIIIVVALVVISIALVYSCNTVPKRTVTLFEWNISYNELKEQMQDTYDDVTCVDENYGCSVEIENYNGDKGVTAAVAYSCNDTTQEFEKITVLLNTEDSDDYDNESLFEKYIDEFTKTYGKPDIDSDLWYKWSTGDMDITLMPSGESLFIIYECE